METSWEQKFIVNKRWNIYITDYCNTIDDTDFNLLVSYYFSILREYPEIFYGDNKVRVIYSYYPSSKKVSACKLKIQYIDSKENIYNMKDEFNRKVNYEFGQYWIGNNNKLKCINLSQINIKSYN